MMESSDLRVLNSETTERRVPRREMVQQLLAGAGAGMAWSLVPAAHPIHAHFANGAILDEADSLGAANWKPLFLNAEQNRELLPLSESIVPGSTKALVNRFIDLLLSVDTTEHRIKFSASLLAMDEEAKKRFWHPFSALSAGQRLSLLTAVSTKPDDDEKSAAELYAHFENLKGWISGAYYSSEIGMRELGWTEEFAFGSYPGCEHAEGHV
jgi:hypothetical protein